MFVSISLRVFNPLKRRVLYPKFVFALGNHNLLRCLLEWLWMSKNLLKNDDKSAELTSLDSRKEVWHCDESDYLKVTTSKKESLHLIEQRVQTIVVWVDICFIRRSLSWSCRELPQRYRRNWIKGRLLCCRRVLILFICHETSNAAPARSTCVHVPNIFF